MQDIAVPAKSFAMLLAVTATLQIQYKQQPQRGTTKILQFSFSAGVYPFCKVVSSISFICSTELISRLLVQNTNPKNTDCFKSVDCFQFLRRACKKWFLMWKDSALQSLLRQIDAETVESRNRRARTGAGRNCYALSVFRCTSTGPVVIKRVYLYLYFGGWIFCLLCKPQFSFHFPFVQLWEGSGSQRVAR